MATEMKILGTGATSDLAPPGIKRASLALSRNRGGVAFFFLCAFYFVYCLRPEDWWTPLAIVPVAKVTAI